MKKRKAMLFVIALSTLLVFAGLNLGENEPQNVENTEIAESTSQAVRQGANSAQFNSQTQTEDEAQTEDEIQTEEDTPTAGETQTEGETPTAVETLTEGETQTASETQVSNPAQTTGETDETSETSDVTAPQTTDEAEGQQVAIDASRAYYQVDEVALYIHTFGELPRNYLTKKEAIELGWDSDKGNLWLVTDQMVIGGDVFGNREGLLPKATGRTWYECDVNYTGGYRSSMRIVYSNDGLIYYTEDHYESFEKLYD